MLERFVYLVGSPRGGTSIIKNSFYLSDRVLALPSMTLFTNRVWRQRNKIEEQVLLRLFEKPEFYRKDVVLEGVDDATRNWLSGRIQEAFAQKHFGRMYTLYPLFYALDPDCRKDPKQALCWADKANDVYGLFDIPRYLPDARFIFIARDPRATVASMQRQTLMMQERSGAPLEAAAALIESCLYWRHMMQSCLRFNGRYPDRSTFIFYEDFVRDAQEVINRLHEFAVGERMPQDALRAGLAKFPHKRKHDRSAHGFGIDKRPLERWRQMLSPEDLNLATALTWRTGRKLRYEVNPPTGWFTVLRGLTRLTDWRSRAVALAKFTYLEAMELLTPVMPAAAAAERTRPKTGLSHAERLRRVQHIARLLDDQFAIPSTNIRFGLDSVVGLVPGVGDLVTSSLSLLIIHHAWQAGIPRSTLRRMLGNIAIDLAFGSVPVIGDAFDVIWKANRMNAHLLEHHLYGTSSLPSGASSVQT